MLVIPICAYMIGHVLDDAPIGPALPQRFQHLVKPLNSPLGAGKRTFFFEAWASREYHVSEFAGLAEEDVLRNEKLELGEPILNDVGVRVNQSDFFAEDVHGL